ncbi:hypothetical protein ABIE26_001588 [Pedobacter africanus]|uniref:Uncharacterized protein n=1 Tax=Pedobacter africanus TaxID=151894 RepID=A0ACC6KS27_9SPHI|nr:hypothetical protein [Pedobacter africanus]MDR6781923.1 hypothetical protein [Pedobacter africanus]
MAEAIVIRRRRSGSLLVAIEMLLISAYSTYWLCKKFDLDWILGTLIFIGSMFVIAFLFFRIRVFRYIFSIIFSLAWGFVALAIAFMLTKSNVSPWILSVVVFGIGLLVHKGHFTAEDSTEVIHYK